MILSPLRRCLHRLIGLSRNLLLGMSRVQPLQFAMQTSSLDHSLPCSDYFLADRSDQQLATLDVYGNERADSDASSLIA